MATEIKNVVLHSFNKDGSINQDVIIYPQVRTDNMVDADNKEFTPQKNLDGQYIKNITVTEDKSTLLIYDGGDNCTSFSGGGNINIANGSGTNSLIQKGDTVTFTVDNPNATNNGTTVNAESAGSKSSAVFNGGARAIGSRSFAANSKTQAIADRTAAFGNQCVAEGTNSFVCGNQATTKGNASFATGSRSLAQGGYSFVYGEETQATGTASYAGGFKTTASGGYSHAEGYQTTASGSVSHSEGQNNIAYGDQSHIEGLNNTIGVINDHLKGIASHVEGGSNQATGNYAHVSGLGNVSNYDYQFICGHHNLNKSDNLFEVGNGQAGSGKNAFEVAEDGTAKIGKMGTDDLSIATKKYVDDHGGSGGATNLQNGSGSCSIQLKNGTLGSTATGNCASAFGNGCTASKNLAAVFGSANTAGGYASTVFGANNSTTIDYSVIFGYYNDTRSDALFAIGNGTRTKRNNAFEVYQDGTAKVGKMGADNLSIATKAYVDSQSGSQAPQLIEITWASLKELRDNGTLVPGRQYKIIDYQCTTTQIDTQSAGHSFNIIVTADSSTTLNEKARAQVSNDNYFNESELEAWELKYCIDNDTSRFAWADTVNGKGVIYYMKDEFNNECPYDFKNIQFKRIVTSVNPEYQSYYDESIFNLYHYWATSTYTPAGLILGDTSDFIWAYTFHDTISSTDASLLHQEAVGYDGSTCVHDNIIKEYKVVQSIEETTAQHPISLNNIVMYYRVYDDENVSVGIYGNKFGVNCHTMTFSKKCSPNTFGNECYNNTFGNECDNNTFDDHCISNTFGNWCYSNICGAGYRSNISGDYCHHNVFGTGYYSNSLKYSCSYNVFGAGCNYNTLGHTCHYNVFGAGCNYNTLAALAPASNAQYNIFENGVCYVDLRAKAAASTALQNIKIRQGISGIHSSRKVISEDRGLTHDVTYRASGYEDKTA